MSAKGNTINSWCGFMA